jgi:hypothetical protein
VSTIGDFAFRGCESLPSVIIPDNIIDLGAVTFLGCTSLSSVTFSGTPKITSINNNVFDGCTALAEINIPRNVMSIGANAFLNCTSLATVYFQQTSALPNINATAFPTSPKPQTAYYKMGVTSPTVGTTAAEYLEEYFVTAIEEAPPPVICFKEDSTVLCLKDEKEVYVPIQNIRRGDLVKTFCSGFVPVNMIGTSKV